MGRDAYSKIKSIARLRKILCVLRKSGKKIVHCHGVFDLLHPGHIKHFESAKKKGDVLIVTLTKEEYVNKGPGRPIFNQKSVLVLRSRLTPGEDTSSMYLVSIRLLSSNI